MLEALKEAMVTGRWARPVAWRGLRGAFHWNGEGNLGGWRRVPSSRGGDPALLPDPADLFGEWEVVIPGEVNRGR